MVELIRVGFLDRKGGELAVSLGLAYVYCYSIGYGFLILTYSRKHSWYSWEIVQTLFEKSFLFGIQGSDSKQKIRLPDFLKLTFKGDFS